MLTSDFAQHFATEWIAAWNAHDLDRILSHYRDDFEMSSPFITRLVGHESGALSGKTAVAAYWRTALSRMPDLHFELFDVMIGASSICLVYQSVLGLKATEWFLFDTDLKVSKAMAHYDRLP